MIKRDTYPEMARTITPNIAPVVETINEVPETPVKTGRGRATK